MNSYVAGADGDPDTQGNMQDFILQGNMQRFHFRPDTDGCSDTQACDGLIGMPPPPPNPAVRQCMTTTTLAPL